MKHSMIIALFFVGYSGFAQQKWLSLDANSTLKDPRFSQQAEIKTLTMNENGIQLHFKLSGILLDHAKGDGIQFTEVQIPGSGIADTIGQPKLPVQRLFFLALENDSTWNYQLKNVQTRTIHLSDFGYPGWIYPKQDPVPKLPGAKERATFKWDRSFYENGSNRKDTHASVSSIGKIRGYQLMMIEWTPVLSDPVAGTIDILESAEMQIQFDHSFMNAHSDLFLSKWSELLNKPDKPTNRGTGNYLILVADIFQNDIADFVTAKTAQGFTVQTQVVANGTSAADIKANITALWGTPQAPDYVLIIGDVETIPAWTGQGAGTPNTDIQYGCMDGTSDWYPDMAIGRFPVDNVTQLEHVIDKTLFFEDGNFPLPEYTTEAVFMASTDNYNITEGTHNYVIDNYLTPAGLSSEKLYTVTYNATTQQVSDAFNAGRIYGIYSGHGGTTSWADGPAFSQSDVNALTNTGLYSFVCSFACVTGSYHLDECFTETWILAEEKGACAIYGSSVNSYWTEDDILEKVLFEAIYTDSIREVSPAWQEAMVKFLAHFGADSTTRRYYEMYNLMGDPSLFIPEPGGGSAMGVSPFKGYTAEGPYGGPFTPDNQEFVIENRSETAFDFSVQTTEAWLSVSPATGSVAPGATVTITVSFTNQANTLNHGTYEADIEFTNTTSNDGDTSRTVTLIVGIPEMIYEFNLDEDPQWSMEGDWAYGIPTGQGGGYNKPPDPTSGATGDYVIGYNLNGNYSSNMQAPEYVTTTAIDCSELSRVSLAFQRWLGVENNQYDHANIEASIDGTEWITVFENSSTIADEAWVEKTYDLSEFADGAPQLYIRWSMGPTDSSVVYCGWNIDDIQIWGLRPIEIDPCPADINDDGNVDMSDLEAICQTWKDPEVDINGFCNTDILQLLGVLESFGACPAD